MFVNQLKLFFMHKKTTLKDFKVFLLKTVLPILFLGMSFQVAVAQELRTTNGKKGQAISRPTQTDASANKAIVSQQTGTATNLRAAGVAARTASTRGTGSTAAAVGTPTDVATINQAYAAKLALNPHMVVNSQISTPTPNLVGDVCTFTGSLASTDLQLTAGRFFRDGVPAVCGSSKACGGAFGTGPYYYDTIRVYNNSCAPQCATVTYVADGAAGDVFGVAYLGSFNPANLCTNFLADGGSSSLAGGASVTFGFTLAAGQSALLVINGAQVATACDHYTVTVTGVNCAPPPPCNAPTSAVLSQVQIPGAAVQLFNQNFDGAIPPAGWPVQNLSTPLGATGWFQNPTPFPPHAGAGYAAANFNNTSGVGTISNWMFAPNVNLKNGDVFTFWTRTTTGTFPDRLQVRMSTNGASVNVGATESTVGDFTTLLLDINPTLNGTGYPTAWTQYTLTMSGLPAAGISGRIAFRYYVTGGGPAGANSDFIGIDDAIYTTTATVDPTTCTGSTANLKVIVGGGTPGVTYDVVIHPSVGANIVANDYTSGNNIPVTPGVTTTYNLVSVYIHNTCCLGTGYTGTPTITVSPTVVAPITVSASPSGPLCAGSPTLLTVIGAPSTGTANGTTGAISVVIPDSNPIGAIVPVTIGGIPGGATGTSASVIFNITHTWDSDLNLFLQSPNAQVLNLVSARGGSGDNFTNTVISSTSATSLGTGAAPFTGTFAPDGNLAAAAPTGVTVTANTFTPLINTTSLNGTWNFMGRDNAGGDVGTILNVGITVNYSIPAGPPVGFTYLWTPASGLSSTTTSPVAASPMTTTTYTVMGTAPSGCQTTGNITITVYQLPAVTTQPSNITVCTNGNATFTVAATGQGISYQWQESTNAGVTYTNITNGGIYSGATTSSLTLTGAPFTMNGYRYRCVISGTCAPAANSNGAILTLNALPNVAVTPTSGCGGVAGVSGLLLSTGSLAPPVPGTATFNSGAISVAIPEGNFPNPPATAATNTIAVSGIPGTATVTGISIKSNITHAYVGDVIMVLKAPNGQIFNLDALLNKTNNPGANFVNNVISSTGVTTLNLGTAPFTGTFKADAVGATFTAFGFTLAGGPVGYAPTTTTWSSLYSTPNGNWTLAAYDAGAPDLGNLTSWEIKIDYTTPGGSGSPLTFTWAPAAGLYTNATTTNAYVAGTQTPSVYAAPTAFTVYTVTGTDGTTGCSNTAVALVNYTPPAPAVTPNPVAMCLGDAAVRLTSSSSSSTTISVNSGTISVVVPDANPAGAVSNLSVAGVPATGTVSAIKVTWNMAHTWDGDMVFALKAPNGQILNLDYLLSSTGGTGATVGFVNTAVSSTGTASLGSGSGTYTGTFKADAVITSGLAGAGGPTGYTPTTSSWAPLFATGAAANGTYTLAMKDGFGGDQGTLTSWQIDVTYFVGVPSTAATWSPVGGLFTDPLATVAYTGTPRDTVYARPTPAGTYTYNVTVNSLPPTPAVPSSPMAGGNGNNMVLFNVANNNGIQYTMTSISTNAFASGVATAVNIYRKTSPIAGNPGAINAGNGWNLMGTASNVTVTGNTLNNVLSGLNIPVPAGATYGIALEFTGAATFPAYTNGTGVVQTYTSNGCSIITDGNIGWGGPVAPGPPANNPRNFNGSVTMVASVAACTSPARSVVVTVNTPISITTQPTNAVVCTDKSTSFTVVAAGTTPTYQWQLSTDAGTTFTNVSNGGVYSGATTATLTITAPPVSYNGNIYRCMVSGAAPCPPVPSANRVLTVNPLPTIIISASPYQNLLPTLSTTLFSTSSPAAANYTWLRNGFAVSGATASSLLIRVDGQGSYRLRVVDVNGCINLSNTLVIADSTSGRVFISPNPTSGQFVVRYNPAHNIVTPNGVNIFDAMGKRVLTQKFTLGIPFAPMAIDLSNQATGVYWVEVVDLDGNRLAVGRVEVIR